MSFKLVMGRLILIIPIFINLIRCEDCGLSSINNQFPWNVGVFIENSNIDGIELICFASIIKSNALITAAHCFCDNYGKLKDDSFYVVFGDLQKRIERNHFNGKVMYKIIKEKININRNFRGLINSAANDIALIQLDRKLSFNDSVKPICIDWVNFKKINSDRGKQAVWNNKVEIIEKTIKDNLNCYSEASEELVKFVTSDKICTISTGNQATREDEGAGLVTYDDEEKRWYLHGVKCLDGKADGQFSIYTTISQHLNWLSNIIAKL